MQRGAGLQFYYIISDIKVAEYALVFKLQVILLIMEGNEKSERKK